LDPNVANTGDLDIDGLSDVLEINTYGTNATNPDTDGDGIPDAYEINNGLNPIVNDAEGDLDGDGISNGQEYTDSTDPNQPNEDQDPAWIIPVAGVGALAAIGIILGIRKQKQAR
jgi:hypothetical protein